MNLRHRDVAKSPSTCSLLARQSVLLFPPARPKPEDSCRTLADAFVPHFDSAHKSANWPHSAQSLHPSSPAQAIRDRPRVLNDNVRLVDLGWVPSRVLPVAGWSS